MTRHTHPSRPKNSGFGSEQPSANPTMLDYVEIAIHGSRAQRRAAMRLIRRSPEHSAEVEAFISSERAKLPGRTTCLL